MEQFKTQQQDLVQKKKWNWKKISILAGAGTFLITGVGLISWGVTKVYVTHKTQVKVNKNKNEIWIGQANDFGSHSIVSKVKASFKVDEKINFEFDGSYLQNDQWGKY